MMLVVGSYSKITDPGIHLYQLESPGNRFIPVSGIPGIENPSYLNTDPDQRLIYAITEKKKDAAAELHIYHLEHNKTHAELISCIPFQGSGSCFISIDSTRTHAFITNYGDGTLTVVKLPKADLPAKVVQLLEFSGSGPNKQRQDQPHLHAALLSPNERFLYCSDLGSDRLYQFTYHPDADTPLQASELNYVELPPGSGPRHLAISPDGSRLYLITELSGDIFVFDTNDFYNGWLQQISLLQDGYTGKIEAADIHMHPGGSYLYASNRGDANEIIVFQIQPVSGSLNFVQRIGAAGLSPRNLLICEHQGLLLVANEQSDNISIFNLNSDGTLEFTKEHLQVPCLTCLKSMI
jgi:6-phosphogluconolactonase